MDGNHCRVASWLNGLYIILFLTKKSKIYTKYGCDLTFQIK